MKTPLNPSNPTPTISEAARRAARKYADQVAPLGSDANDWVRIIEQLTPIIKEALDSAHPAPKEGATPETDAFKQAHQYKSPSKKQWEKHARSLELRLSEAKRKQEMADKEANDFQSRLFDVLRERDSLRSHLKTANELLGEIKEVLETRAVGHTIMYSDRVTGFISRITAHLNQQSK